jgi:Icc-related predicted phosphoesterase
MNPIKVAAVADVHSPRFLVEFKEALMRCEQPDLLLFAGDMVNRGKADEYTRVLDVVDSQFGTEIPIVACYGNEDPYEVRDELQEAVQGRLSFLHEDSLTLDISGKRIAIVGISVENPEVETNDVAEMQSIFEKRASRLSHLLHDTSKSTDVQILLMHFSPLLQTNLSEFSWWVSKAVETTTPQLIIHGHVHDAAREKVEIGATTILNVALPVTGSITELTF